MKMTFEEGMGRLSQITTQLEAGNLSLDESIKLYEEATKIIAQCDELLKKAKLKISVIEKPTQGPQEDSKKVEEETSDEDTGTTDT